MTSSRSKGLDYYGRTYGRPTKDVLVRRCEIAAGAGPTIGSEMSGGVENVTFEDITLDSEELGITLKTARGQFRSYNVHAPAQEKTKQTRRDSDVGSESKAARVLGCLKSSVGV